MKKLLIHSFQINCKRQFSITTMTSEPKWKKIHQEKVEKGELHYEDPDTGYCVFTELAHKKRDYCCGSECRHCPFDFKNVGKPDQLKQDKLNAKLNKSK